MLHSVSLVGKRVKTPSQQGNNIDKKSGTIASACKSVHACVCVCALPIFLGSSVLSPIGSGTEGS